MTDPKASELRLEHYRTEKALASQLMAASKEQRRHLYTELYDELLRRVPHHPMLLHKASAQMTSAAVQEYIRLLRPYLKANTHFLEIGPGDCTLAFNVAAIAARVYAVDVSNEITRTASCPPNFQLILSDGCSIPVPAGSINCAFSNQLMEHLHPDDAFEQLSNIVRALAPGGIYMCMTPNRLSGPHDVSKYFDHVATGFHLREYTAGELSALFGKAGFSRVKLLVRVKGHYFGMPRLLHEAIEGFIGCLPVGARRRMAEAYPLRLLLHSIYMIGFK